MFKFFFKINLIGYYTILTKEFLRIIRIWPQTILPSIINVIIYFVIFGKIIGVKIGDIYGYKYIQYLLPGLIMMLVVNSAYSNVAFSLFSIKFQKSIEELIVAPLWIFTIIIGFIFGGIIRAFFILIILFFITYFFCDIYFYNFVLFCLIFYFTAVLFSLFGFLNGIFSKKFDDISLVPTFILTPLIYFSGIFFSIDLLPNFLKILVCFNPMFYIVNIFRYSFLGISEVNIYFSIFFVLFFIVLLYVLCMYSFYLGYCIKK